MPRVETLVLWKVLHVAFIFTDYSQAQDVSVGITRGHAMARCLDRHQDRWNRRVNQ